MNDQISQLETQLSEQSSEVSLWRSFIEHPGWAKLRELVEQDMRIRMEVVVSTPLNLDSNIYAQEFFKGEFKGAAEVLGRPEALLEQAKREVEILSQHLENEHETEKRISDAERSRVDTSDHFGE
jgi:hypothetical protein